MRLFSFLRKKKQESASGDSAYYSRAEEESSAARGGSRRRKSKDNESADPMLPEKKRARRRLIGAIALVLAAIIGLPMILDSEPKPVASDIAIQIPSKDKPAQPAVRAPAAPDPKEDMVEPPTAAAPEAPAEKPNEDVKTVKPARPAAVEKPPAVPPKVDSKPEPRTARPDDSARALALLEGKSDPKPQAEKKSGKFVIQVAALTTKERVNELQTRLKGAGIESFTQRVATDGGERIRIRVGPFSSRDEADRVRARIVKLGLNGTIVPA